MAGRLVPCCRLRQIGLGSTSKSKRESIGSTTFSPPRCKPCVVRRVREALNVRSKNTVVAEDGEAPGDEEGKLKG